MNELWAVCGECHHRHKIGAANFRQEWADWLHRHKGHKTNIAYGQVLLTDEEEWKRYKHNADVKVSYAASAAYTITLASLATSATWVAGQESTGISNGTNKYLDFLIGGKITVGTTPTASTVIEVWAIPAVNDTPLYPDVFDGTDSAETATTRAILISNGHILGALSVEAATSNVTHWLRNTSLIRASKALTPPVAHSLFVAHNTGVNLNATGSNHALYHTPVFATVV